MTRVVTAAMQTEIEKQQIRTFILIDFVFTSPLYLTNLNRSIVYLSNTYSPSIGLLVTPVIREKFSIATSTVSIQLSGANLANLSTALNENYNDKQVLIRRAVYDASYALVADPILIFDGRVVNFSFSENIKNGESAISWEIASHFSDFEKVSGRRANNQDQQIYYANDDSFEFVGDTGELLWGRK